MSTRIHTHSYLHIQANNTQEATIAPTTHPYTNYTNVSNTSMAGKHVFSYRKSLFSAVHNFVHLNLAITLFIGYLVFAVGIELGARNKVSITPESLTSLYQFLLL